VATTLLAVTGTQYAQLLEVLRSGLMVTLEDDHAKLENYSLELAASKDHFKMSVRFMRSNFSFRTMSRAAGGWCTSNS